MSDVKDGLFFFWWLVAIMALLFYLFDIVTANTATVHIAIAVVNMIGLEELQ